MLRRLALAAVVAASAATAANAQDAQCEDWWFARNLIFDRAGYCFASPLGRALFDNADCSTTAPNLPADLAAQVAQIRALEAEFACAVDTTRGSLSDPQSVDAYRAMWDIPVRDLGESGCIGYRGPVVTLRLGAREDAPVAGTIQPGMSIGFGHVGRNGYDYVTVIPMSGGEPQLKDAVTGWGRLGPQPLPCDAYAG